jgi:folylpolyglutamate synthase/dihydropteroate synthase
METFDLKSLGAEGGNEGDVHDPIIVLDGCHNTLSVNLCVRGLREHYPAQKGYDLWVAFGSGKDKNLDAMLEAVMQTADGMIATVSKHFRALGNTLLEIHMYLGYAGEWICVDVRLCSPYL